MFPDFRCPVFRWQLYDDDANFVLGAWILLDGKEVKVYGSKLWHEDLPSGSHIHVEGSTGLVHSDGLLLGGNDGKFVNVKLLHVDGKFVQVCP